MSLFVRKNKGRKYWYIEWYENKRKKSEYLGAVENGKPNLKIEILANLLGRVLTEPIVKQLRKLDGLLNLSVCDSCPKRDRPPSHRPLVVVRKESAVQFKCAECLREDIEKYPCSWMIVSPEKVKQGKLRGPKPKGKIFAFMVYM